MFPEIESLTCASWGSKTWRIMMDLSKYDPKKKGVFFPPEMLNSNAYEELSKFPTALKMLVGFYRRINKTKNRMGKPGKRKDKYIPVNMKEIIYTYGEMQTDTMVKSRSTIRNNLDKLINFGFIDIEIPGNGHARMATIYGISDRWKNYGTQFFIEKPRERDARLGAELRKYQANRKEDISRMHSRDDYSELKKLIIGATKIGIKKLGNEAGITDIILIGKNKKFRDTIKIPNRIIKRRQYNLNHKVKFKIKFDE